MNVDRGGNFKDDMDETKAVLGRSENCGRLSQIRTGSVASASVILEICVRKEAFSTVRNSQTQGLLARHSDRLTRQYHSLGHTKKACG